MIFDIDQKNAQHIAIKDSEGFCMTYGEIGEFISDPFFTTLKRELVFILCKNSVGAVALFLSCIQNKAVALLVDVDMDYAQLSELISIYSPAYCFVCGNRKIPGNESVVNTFLNYKIIKTGLKSPKTFHGLSFLLSTSGSTGSPKLVRHSYKNLEANVVNVASTFRIQPDERAISSLPIFFTQGLSVVCGNIYAGATVLITNLPLTSKEFWDFIKKEQATSFSGVPYSYEILNRLRFFAMDLPHLKVINQGGGRLTDEMFSKLADYAYKKKGKFIATYGATETTSRMAYLPPELAKEKIGSIGIAMPCGTMKIVNDTGDEVFVPNTVGELVYEGDNVTLGYAQAAADLSNGDEFQGVYHTGDLAKKDADGCFYIVGRKSRFVKLFGYRVGLDEIERIVKQNITSNCTCIGNDEKVYIFILDSSLKEAVLRCVTEKTGIHASGFEVRVINEIPKNTAGKTLYAELESFV